MNVCTHSHKDGQVHQLVINGLSVAYRDKVVLEDINLNNRCGNCVALVGPNGAGKSTLLKSIAGLVRPFRGNVTWAGVLSQKCLGGEFAYLPQNKDVNWDFPVTVRGVVEMGRYSQLGSWKRFRQIDHDAVDHALALMEMDGPLAQRQISELSGGQRQRAFIARAVAQEAHVLLLDEPFTGLDRDHTRNLARLLRKLASEHRLVVASHHDLNTLDSIFDDVVLLNRRLIGQGATADTLTAENIEETFAGEPVSYEPDRRKAE